MTVTAPETELRNRLISVLNTEFTAEKIVFQSDKLHDSQGQNGDIGAVYPGPANARSSNGHRGAGHEPGPAARLPADIPRVGYAVFEP